MTTTSNKEKKTANGATFEIKDLPTRVRVKRGRIEEEKTDIIVNWVNPDMRSGPKSFYSIHMKAGPQLFNYTLSFDDAITETDAFSTAPAQLDCKLVVHAVIPAVNKNGYLKAFYQIAETVKTYKEQNLARELSLYIPEQADICLAGIYTFLLDVGLKNVNILFLTDKEFKKINSFFEQYKKKDSLWSRVDKTIIRGMVRLYSSSSTTFRAFPATARCQRMFSRILRRLSTTSERKLDSKSTAEAKSQG